ncbi:MAG: helix-turn-helix transcriptional regulator [Acidimicrobiales bacterium]
MSGLLDRVTRRCAEHVEERLLRIALVEDIRQTVSFGAHVWALTDPETEVGTSPFADVPQEAVRELPRLIRCRYLTLVNRWNTLEGPAASLLRATRGSPDASLLYREVLAPFGVSDVATVMFRDRHGCWGWLDLWRFTGDDPFSDRDLAVLSAITVPVTEALRRCQARSFDDPTPTPVRSGPVVLFLSPALEVLAQTPETDAYLRTLLPPDADQRPIPAGAYNVAGQLLAVEAGIDTQPPLSRVRLVGGVWLTFRAARVDSSAPEAERDIAVTIEPTTPAERRLLYARSHALSPREAELLDLLVEGADTKAVADALFLSQHTVQDHLKSIFAKTGAHNRRTLLTRVTGR